MKKNCSVIFVLLLCLFLMFVSSCDDSISNQNLSGFGSISMTIDNTVSKTIQPDTSQLAFVSYRIVGRKSTAETATVDRSFTEKTVTIDNLETGNWLFYIEGYNKDHILIGKSDFHEVVIERNKTIQESYILKKIEGQGVLSLSIKTQMSRVASITCTLEQEGKDPLVLSLTKSDSVLGDDGLYLFSKSFSVQQGEYNGTIVMTNDDDIVIGKSLHPSVHIYSGLESAYTFSWEKLKNLLPTVDNPVPSIESGRYPTGSEVSFSTEEEGTVIYYSTGGEYLEYQEPIIINENTTINVFASKANMNQSEIRAYSYICKVSNPEISLASGSFSSVDSHSVTISESDQNAVVYYTLDGSDPLTSPARITYVESIPISTNTDLKVVACEDGYISSDVVETSYRYTVPNPTISLQSGSYSSDETKTVTINCEDSDAIVYYTTDGTNPLNSETRYCFSSSKQLSIDRSCNLRVVACSEDCTASEELLRNYEFVVPTPESSLGSSIFTGGETKTIILSCSDTEATVFYTIDGSNPLSSSTRSSFNESQSISITRNTSLNMIAVKDNCTTSPQLSRVYEFIVPSVSFSITPGTYYDGQELVLSLALEDSVIYYTLDGSNPTIDSSVYSGKIVLNNNCTVSAIGVHEGMTNSNVVSNSYTIKVKAPTITPESCSYEGSKTITISCDTEDALVYYTLDGTNPTSSTGILYTEPFDIDYSASFKIIALKNNLADSDIVEGVFTRTDTTSDGVFSVTSNGVLTVANKNSLPSNVVVPNRINGTVVSSIADYAFSGCTGLTSIVIPDSVTNIGQSAFYGCSNLEEMTLPFVGESLTASDNYARVFGYIFGYLASSVYVSGATYQGVEYLSSQIHYYIPYSLRTVRITNQETIPANAFYACGMLTSLILSDKTTEIGDYAFHGCFRLTSMTVPNGVTSIGDYAFYGCSGLTSMEIPSLVTSIGNSAFSDCTGLTSIDIPNSVTSIGNDAFYGCSGLTSIEIPNSVTSIGSYAFYDCTGITSMTVPNGVTSIGDYAFYGCSGLTSIEIPNSVTRIERAAFYGCTGLTNIDIPNSVTSIGNSAFSDCTGLTSIVIPSSVTSIENHTFRGCTSLTSIEITNSITSIGFSAFYDCSVLTNIEIPNSVTSIGSYAFYGCACLTSIEVPNSVTSIEEYTFYGCSGLTSIVIPSSVTSIGRSAFYKCTGLTSIDIPNSVTSIGNDAFSNCTGLESIEIPNSVTSIGSGVFGKCTKLTSIEIPNSVSRIGNYSFRNCSRLVSIVIPNSVTSIGYEAFDGCTELTSITIPSSVVEYSFYENYHYGVFDGYHGEIVFAEGTTTIPAFALYEADVSSVTIPSTVTSIGNTAFKNCSGLTSVLYKGTQESWSAIDGVSSLPQSVLDIVVFE